MDSDEVFDASVAVTPLLCSVIVWPCHCCLICGTQPSVASWIWSLWAASSLSTSGFCFWQLVDMCFWHLGLPKICTIPSCPCSFCIFEGDFCSLFLKMATLPLFLFFRRILVQPSGAVFWCQRLVQLSGALICFTCAALWWTILFHLSETHCMLTPLGSKNSSASVHASYYWFWAFFLHPY